MFILIRFSTEAMRGIQYEKIPGKKGPDACKERMAWLGI
jgi:hypothetical protein